LPYVKRKKRLDEDGKPMDSSRPARSSWTVELPLYALIFGCPLALGTVHLSAVVGMWALSLFAFFALLVQTRRRRLRLRLFPMGLGLLVVAGFTLLQLLPLPPGLVALLSPGAGEVADQIRTGTPLAGSWQTLSLAPPATAFEAIKWLAYLLAFLVAVNYFNERHRARRALKAVAWAGFVVALLGFFSKLFMADKIFGLYPLPHGDLFFFASFVNPNHLAGFLGLCSPVALGLALSARERQDRALYGFMGVIVGMAVFMTLSRGGMVAFAASMTFLLVYSATRGSRRIKRLAMVQALAAAVLLLAGYMAYDTIMKELRTLGDVEALREDTKIKSWAVLPEMMMDHPVTGIGRGAYATVYPRYKELPSQSTFTHAENQPLQYMVEWGPLVGGAFLLMLLSCFVMGLVRTKESFSLAGALTGIFFVMSQNLVDFNMEIGGIMMPMLLLFAVLAASPFSHAGMPIEQVRFALGRKSAWSLGLISAAVVVLALPHAWLYNLDKLSAALLTHDKAKTGAEPCDDSPLGRAACDLIKHYPADHLAPLLLGKLHLESTPPKLDRASHWLARASWLNPTQPQAHRLIGRALFFAGHKNQALGEYRRAAESNRELLTATISEVLRLTNDPASAIRATPDDASAYLQTARMLRTLGRHDEARKAAGLALDKDATLLPAMDLLGAMALQQGLLQEAATIAQQAIEADPLHEQAYVLKGQVLMAQKKPIEAEAAWKEGMLQVPESTQLAHKLVNFYLGQGRARDAEHVASRMQTFIAPDDRSQARMLMLIGRIKETREQFFEARQVFRQALQLSPDTLPYVFRLAKAEERIGNWDEAEKLYVQLIDKHFRAKQMTERLKLVKKAREMERSKAMWNTWIDKKEEKDNKGK